MLSDDERLVARYTSGQENEYFGWVDAIHDNVRQLATKFTERFSAIVDASRGDDWEYAGWYVRMLGYAERELFPVSYADWYEEPDHCFLPLWGGESDLPMPPPGDAKDRSEK